MRATWIDTRNGEALHVWAEGPDQDGDFEVWLHHERHNPQASWTTFKVELAENRVILEFA